MAALGRVRTEEEALEFVATQQQAHPKCNHHCYAYRLGEGRDRYRANDDGEPSGTAGRPILGQIDKAALSDCIVVVSRYFGGTKLGTSGLINAYREAAKLAIEAADTGWQPLTASLTLHFGYDLMGEVLSALSQLGLEMAGQDFGQTAWVRIEVPRSTAAATVRALKAAIAGVYREEVTEDFEVAGLRLECVV